MRLIINSKRFYFPFILILGIFSLGLSSFDYSDYSDHLDYYRISTPGGLQTHRLPGSARQKTSLAGKKRKETMVQAASLPYQCGPTTAGADINDEWCLSMPPEIRNHGK